MRSFSFIVLTFYLSISSAASNCSDVFLPQPQKAWKASRLTDPTNHSDNYRYIIRVERNWEGLSLQKAAESARTLKSRPFIAASLVSRKHNARFAGWPWAFILKTNEQSVFATDFTDMMSWRITAGAGQPRIVKVFRDGAFVDQQMTFPEHIEHFRDEYPVRTPDELLDPTNLEDYGNEMNEILLRPRKESTDVAGIIYYENAPLKFVDPMLKRENLELFLENLGRELGIPLIKVRE